MNILFCTQNLEPFVSRDRISDNVRKLILSHKLSKNSSRIFMPKFGIINERKYQLHEVIRLSMSIISIGDIDYPLVVKVASLPQNRVQVYFIDTDYFFSNNTIFHSEDGVFLQNNVDRAIFFTLGMLEVTRKLGWRYDMVHCHGWFASFITFYRHKITGSAESIKIVTSIYGFDKFEGKLSGDILQKLSLLEDKVSPEVVALLKKPTYEALIIAVSILSDVIIVEDKEMLSEKLLSTLEKHEDICLVYAEDFQNTEEYIDFFSEILDEKVCIDEI